jgi:hypothetical protein
VARGGGARAAPRRREAAGGNLGRVVGPNLGLTIAEPTIVGRRSEGRVVRFYNRRGTVEQWIKEGKNAVKWTKLSCRRFKDNAARLRLFALAYAFTEHVGRLLILVREGTPIDKPFGTGRMDCRRVLRAGRQPSEDQRHAQVDKVRLSRHRGIRLGRHLHPGRARCGPGRLADLQP